MILEAKALSRSFGGIKALDELSFSIERGEILGVVGPNGSGKTTLLDVLTGLLKPDGGDIWLLGTPISGRAANYISNKGLVRTFQTPRLFGSLTVLENVLMADCIDLEALSAVFSFRRVSKERKRCEEALTILAMVGLADVRDKISAELSLGQMRRVEICRTLMNKNSCVYLYDEPTGGLDPEIIQKLGEIISASGKEGKAIVIVEHNTEFIQLVADRVIVLNEGRQIAAGVPREVFSDPKVAEVYFGGNASKRTCCLT